MAEKRLSYQFGTSAWRDIERGNEKEWLLTNGIGGYANSTVSGNNSRIFSAYLMAALHPPVKRTLVLAKTQEALRFLDKETQEYIDLASQQYPGQAKEGFRYLTSFSYDIVPEYCYQVQGVTIRKQIALAYGKNTVALSYEMINDSSSPVMFSVVPLFNFRPFGEVSSREALRFAKSVYPEKGLLLLVPEKAAEYTICFRSSEGSFYDRKEYPVSMAAPNYLIEENEFYSVDAGNGFTGVDCHYTPYEVRIPVKAGERKQVGLLCELLDTRVCGQYEERCTPMKTGCEVRKIFVDCLQRAKKLIRQAGCGDSLTARLVLSADHFLAKRASTGKMTVLAGYPWFSDWGRDTMIAFCGLTLATRRFEEAAQVLSSFAQYVDRGMIPNVFPDSADDVPMYNTMDASLWYIYAVYQYLRYTTEFCCYYGDCAGSVRGKPKEEKHGREPAAELTKEECFVRDELYPRLTEIVTAYRNGTARYGIHMEEDGLIAGGSHLDQLTWMDVRVGDVVVTPRHGKAVEINALWYNALRIMEVFRQRFCEKGNEAGMDGDCERSGKEGYGELAEKVRKVFADVFWNEREHCLYDVIAPDGQPDTSLRPNQIFAVSLPFSLLPAWQEKEVVQKVYASLYTPYGLRSLAQGEKGYRGKYKGNLLNRDMAYHMGTTWSYLLGAFITAWIRTGGDVREARSMCLRLAEHMADGCLGGIAEIFDGDFADIGRGCYTQAWSVGELLRVWRELAEE